MKKNSPATSRDEAKRRDIRSVLLEQREFPPPAHFAAKAHPNAAELWDLHATADADLEGFWAERARESLQWTKPFTEVLDESKAPNYRWYGDGRTATDKKATRR